MSTSGPGQKVLRRRQSFGPPASGEAVSRVLRFEQKEELHRNCAVTVTTVNEVIGDGHGANARTNTVGGISVHLVDVRKEERVGSTQVGVPSRKACNDHLHQSPSGQGVIGLRAQDAVYSLAIGNPAERREPMEKSGSFKSRPPTDCVNTGE